MNEWDDLITILGRWTITISVSYIDHAISASSSSTIKPLMLPDGTIDQLALDEYEEFVINLLTIFEEAEFEVINERRSPFSNSYYFDLVKKDQADKKNYKYILFVRVSDHILDKDKIQFQRKWLNEHAQNQRQPRSKSFQKWKLKYITVNKDTYYSYEDALDDIELKLNKL